MDPDERHLAAAVLGPLLDPLEQIAPALHAALGLLGQEGRPRQQGTARLGPPIVEHFAEFHGVKLKGRRALGNGALLYRESRRPAGDTLSLT